MITAETADRSVTRPNVLAYPSATTARLLLLLVAVLSGGAYIGISVHDWLLARSFGLAIASCSERSRSSADPATYLISCGWPVQIRRGLFGVGAALIFIILLLAILLIAQSVISRGRPGREMTQYFPDSGEYLDRLRHLSGVAASTRFLVGPASQIDAFTYGALGRYQIQIPRGLAAQWHNRAVFEPVILHELAHVSRRDVTWGWFARAAWYGVTPVLLASALIPAFQHDWSYFWSYAWRLVLLAAVTQLLIRGYLRARETDADLRAAQLLQGTSEITAAIGTIAARPMRRLPALSFHPRADKRISAITDPASTVSSRFIDGFAAALLATLAGGVIRDITGDLFAGLANGVSTAEIVTSGLSYAVLGFAVGGGLLRSVVVGRVTGRRPAIAVPALGVGLGIAVGSITSIAQTGVGIFAGDANYWQIIAAACAGMGAALYSGALARMWSFALPWTARPLLSWTSYCLLATGIFWMAGWAGSRLGDFLENLDIFGWPNIYFQINSWAFVVILSITGMLIIILFSLRSLSSSPKWLLENSAAVTWSGFSRFTRGGSALAAILAGIAGAVAMVAVQESGVEGSSLFYLLVNISLGTGVAGSLAASIVSHRIRGAIALPAAIISSCIALGLSVAVSTIIHLPFDTARLATVALPGITASAVVSLLCVPLVFLPGTFPAEREAAGKR
jgi:Zn-dependent protease with chaperone function